jgi:alkaline phosphatase
VIPQAFVASGEASFATDRAATVRNVILLIGDGMGPQQLGLLSLYAHHAPNSEVPDRIPAIERMMNEGVVGLVRTEPSEALVADSAAAATQFATGEWSGSEMIGATAQGESARTIVELATQLGKSSGLVTNTRITHATPAAFASHQPHRTMENEIAVDLLEHRLDVVLGGGLRHWVPSGVSDPASAVHAGVLQMTGGVFTATSRREDNRHLLLEARSDYQLVFDRFALSQVEQGKLLGLFADSELDDALLERAAQARGDRTQPTLVEMATKALELLDQNPRGFFLMVEGGQIDWAGHNNDAGTLLHEMLRFDATIRAVLEWARGRDDTLVVVTADHETGSFGFSFSGRPLPTPRRLAGRLFAERDFEPDFNFAQAQVLDQLHRQEMSFFNMFRQFDELPSEERTAERLQQMVNASLPFKISLEDAVNILTRQANPMYVEGHPSLGGITSPRIHDFSDFFVFGDNTRMNLLGRAIASQQNVVWGTGTHTSTPVPLAAWGPEAVSRRFSGMLHATEVGQRLQEVLGGGQAAE